MQTVQTMMRRLAPPALAVLAALLAPASPKAEVRDLTLYQKTGRAPLVVWGEVTDGAHRFAAIKTLEVLKCTIPERPGDNFRIAFRLDSFLRRPWEDKIDFVTGERVLLFLRKFTKEDGEQPEGDIYTLMWGAQGRNPLPAEGAEATVDAARTFVSIQSDRDYDRQADRLKEAIGSPNPILVTGAFGELLVEGLGDSGDDPDARRVPGQPSRRHPGAGAETDAADHLRRRHGGS